MPASMKCPRCTDATLVVTDRQDIEIEVCPGCRGVWLDRGELDKLIERSLGLQTAARPAPGPRPYDDDDDDRYRSRPSYERHHDDDHWKSRRKHSWLKELFD